MKKKIFSKNEIDQYTLLEIKMILVNYCFDVNSNAYQKLVKGFNIFVLSLIIFLK
jgi:hypothetical protein